MDSLVEAGPLGSSMGLGTFSATAKSAEKVLR
jgi:hypothetical protein